MKAVSMRPCQMFLYCTVFLNLYSATHSRYHSVVSSTQHEQDRLIANLLHTSQSTAALKNVVLNSVEETGLRLTVDDGIPQ